MGTPNFPPRFDTDHMLPFYEGLNESELRMTACPRCDKWYWYPPEVLPCHPEARVEWRKVSPTGTVYTFTVVHRSLLPGDHKHETPYVNALVESDDVPGCRIPSLLVNLGDREPECGMRVTLKPVRAGDHCVAAFEPLA
jgi:hypothetical protein